MEHQPTQQTKKKQKHAAKGWEFSFRGGIDMINVREIAQTLSRKNPVAVVTLIPQQPDRDNAVKSGVIIIDHSLTHRGFVTGNSIESYLYEEKKDQYVTEEYFDAIFLDDIADAGPILKRLSDFRQTELPVKGEYVAAVNYPII